MSEYKITKDDGIVVWAPSSPAPFLFPKRFKRAIDSLNAYGYRNIKIGESCRQNQFYNNDFAKILAEEFHSYLIDESIKSIFFAVGGWTTSTLFPYIDWELVRENKKVLVGYSDATSLLLACYAKSGMKSFHGPMVISEWGEHGGPWQYTVEKLEEQLCNESSYLDLKPPDYWTQERLWWDKEDFRKRRISGRGEWHFFKGGKTEGVLIGGNLNTISFLIGTEYMPSLKGAILFFETEGFSPDRLLAYLMQLRFHGVFNDICGLIIGRHSNPEVTSSGESSFRNVLHHMFDGYNFPILLDVDLGHTEPMITLPIGGIAMLDSKQNLFRIYKN